MLIECTGWMQNACVAIYYRHPVATVALRANKREQKFAESS